MQLLREVRFQNADQGFQNEHISLFSTAEYPMFAMEAHGSCVSYPGAYLWFTCRSNDAIKRRWCLTSGIMVGGSFALGHIIHPVLQQFITMCLSFAALTAMGRDVSLCSGVRKQPNPSPAASSWVDLLY